MKKLWLVLALVALCSSPSWASDFGLYGSYWNTKDADEGLGGGVKWGIGLGDTSLDLELRGTYFDDVIRNESGFDLELQALPVELGLVWNFSKDESTNPYIGGGFGYHFLDSNVGSVDDEVGYYVVGGADWGGKEGVGFNLEGIYRNMEGTVDRIQGISNISIDDDVKVDLSGLGVNAGVIWRW